MKCRFSKKDLENMIIVFFQKRGAILNEVSLKEVVSGKEASLKCELSLKQNVCGVEKVLKKELDMEEIESIICIAFEESLKEKGKIGNIVYDLGVVGNDLYFNGIEVDVETIVDKTVDKINKDFKRKNK